jgi:superoxide reductase
MTILNQVYKCEICGNIVVVVHDGAGELVCCGQPMNLQVEKEKEEGTEKHLPVVDGATVKVGEVAHPMEADHYIEWIEATTADGQVIRKFLSPNEAPEAVFDGADIKEVREYCSLHGLWKVVL